MDLVSARITRLCERLKLGTVSAECEARERRSREVLLKLATLPAIKTRFISAAGHRRGTRDVLRPCDRARGQ